MREIRAVLLDAGHTLLRVRHGTGHHYAAAARDVAGFEAPPSAYEEAFGRVAEEMGPELFMPAPAGEVNDALEHGRWRRFSLRLYRTLGLVDHEDALWERLYDAFGDPRNWEPYEDTYTALEALRRLDLRLAIVSNWSTHLRGVLEHHDLIAPFDVVVGSCEVGVEKPDPAIFAFALDPLGLAPAEAVHVGDSVHADVGGAEAAGIRGLLLDRHCRHPDRTDRIESLMEIPRRVRS
jgi:REG-2-like HAD superfamily hydrolase